MDTINDSNIWTGLETSPQGDNTTANTTMPKVKLIRRKRKLDKCYITQGINTGWMKWKDLTGALRDERMPVQVKGKVYIRRRMLDPQREDRLHAAEKRMLRSAARPHPKYLYPW
ncbi:unnamed protein product [Arctia plantaginis]|uniref:Uncharacterized protein n=1 Tax=Arctia plantaginis TaxID=874455 RepID=A0A8S1B357_ARCPL|nr:unnamed protein product [Arctia plantaginis]